MLHSLNYDMAAKKRKKDLMNNNSKVPCESETHSEDHCFHTGAGRTRTKTIYQNQAPHQEPMRMLCNADEGRSPRIMLFIINFPSLRCFDNRFTSVECAPPRRNSPPAKMRQAANANTVGFSRRFPQGKVDLCSQRKHQGGNESCHLVSRRLLASSLLMSTC